jgi:hypothetical protein
VIRRIESGASAPYSLPAYQAVHIPGRALSPTSSSETDMYLVPSQMAQSHRQPSLDARQREAQLWRMRRIAVAARRAESAERRARLAREAAVLAARESALAVAP